MIKDIRLINCRPSSSFPFRSPEFSLSLGCYGFLRMRSMLSITCWKRIPSAALTTPGPSLSVRMPSFSIFFHILSKRRSPVVGVDIVAVADMAAGYQELPALLFSSCPPDEIFANAPRTHASDQTVAGRDTDRREQRRRNLLPHMEHQFAGEKPALAASGFCRQVVHRSGLRFGIAEMFIG